MRRSHAIIATVLAIVLEGGLQAGTSSVIYTYDSAGRLATALYGNGTCLVYQYDKVGNRTVQTLQTGSSTVPTWGAGTLGCFKWSP